MDDKNTFQYDAYRPLFTVREVLCPGGFCSGVSVQGEGSMSLWKGSVMRGGSLSRGPLSTDTPLDRDLPCEV